MDNIVYDVAAEQAARRDLQDQMRLATSAQSESDFGVPEELAAEGDFEAPQQLPLSLEGVPEAPVEVPSVVRRTPVARRTREVVVVDESHLAAARRQLLAHRKQRIKRAPIGGPCIFCGQYAMVRLVIYQNTQPFMCGECAKVVVELAPKGLGI